MDVGVDYAVWGTAGSGKTTRLLDRVRENTLETQILSFNVKISKRIKFRTSDIKDRVDVRTLDSLSYLIVREATKKEISIGERELVDKAYELGIRLEDEGNELANKWNNFILKRNQLNNEALSLVGDSRIMALHQYELYLESKNIYTFQKIREVALKELINGFRFELDADLLVVDEIQDVSPLQWKILDIIRKQNNLKMWVAGDLYQTIYQHIGADYDQTEKIFINAKDKEYLTVSHRVPKGIEPVVKDGLRRYGLRDDLFSAYKEGGLVQLLSLNEMIDKFASLVCSMNMPSTDLAILFRTRKRLRMFRRELQRMGVFVFPMDYDYILAFKVFEKIFSQNYRFKDNESDFINKYLVEKPDELPLNRFDKSTAFSQYLSYLKNGRIKSVLEDYFSHHHRRFVEPTQINFANLTTIHAMKGDEVDVVFCDTYIPNPVSKEMTPKNLQNEGCVQFVGRTRAKKALYLFS